MELGKEPGVQGLVQLWRNAIDRAMPEYQAALRWHDSCPKGKKRSIYYCPRADRVLRIETDRSGATGTLEKA